MAGERGPALEIAMGRRAAGVDDPPGIRSWSKWADLLAQDEVFEEDRPAESCLERILVVGDRLGEVGGEELAARVDPDPVERSVARLKPGARWSRSLARQWFQ
jgi:hypothetical protein